MSTLAGTRSKYCHVSRSGRAAVGGSRALDASRQQNTAAVLHSSVGGFGAESICGVSSVAATHTKPVEAQYSNDSPMLRVALGCEPGCSSQRHAGANAR